MTAHLHDEIAALQQRLRVERGTMVTLATAESATSGRIADRVTDVPGASDYFLGGIVAYSNEAKRRLLHVRQATLRAHGAVSPQVAQEMAEGARKALHAQVAVSDTGVAGPGGSTPEKPVGLFYLALATPDGCTAFRFVFQGDRQANKESAAQAALTLLRDYLLQCCNVQGANIDGSL